LEIDAWGTLASGDAVLLIDALADVCVLAFGVAAFGVTFGSRGGDNIGFTVKLGGRYDSEVNFPGSVWGTAPYSAAALPALNGTFSSVVSLPQQAPISSRQLNSLTD
jgi:hypothetical protein